MENINILALIDTDIENDQVIDRGQALYEKFENLWLGSPCCELSIILGVLEYLRGMHHTHHWVSRGDSFYGDHLMFSRIYESIAGEIDLVAEKAVGVSTTAAVDYSRLIEQIGMLDSEFNCNEMMLLPDPSSLAKKSLDAEEAFLSLLRICVDRLEQNDELTLGIDNLLAAIYDSHETHIYLLKQRINGEFS